VSALSVIAPDGFDKRPFDVIDRFLPVPESVPELTENVVSLFTVISAAGVKVRFARLNVVGAELLKISVDDAI